MFVIIFNIVCVNSVLYLHLWNRDKAMYLLSCNIMQEKSVIFSHCLCNKRARWGKRRQKMQLVHTLIMCVSLETTQCWKIIFIPYIFLYWGTWYLRRCAARLGNCFLTFLNTYWLYIQDYESVNSLITQKILSIKPTWCTIFLSIFVSFHHIFRVIMCSSLGVIHTEQQVPRVA